MVISVTLRFRMPRLLLLLYIYTVRNLSICTYQWPLNCSDTVHTVILVECCTMFSTTFERYILFHYTIGSIFIHVALKGAHL